MLGDDACCVNDNTHQLLCWRVQLAADGMTSRAAVSRLQVCMVLEQFRSLCVQVCAGNTTGLAQNDVTGYERPAPA